MINLTPYFNDEKQINYWLDVCVRMTHHSTAIEGNTLSQDETASILLDGYISKPTSEREFYEVRNYKNILPKVFDSLNENTKLDANLIRNFHEIIMEKIIDNNGKFKTTENMVVGATFEPTKPYLVPVAIKDMCDNLYFKLQNSKSNDNKLKAILESHIEFEKIHPFSDGNGRTGRVLIIYSCLENNLTPIIIPKEQKSRYISILRNNDIDEFMKFAKEIAENEKQRYLKFTQSAIQDKQDDAKSVLAGLGETCTKKVESGAIKASEKNEKSKSKDR